MIVTGEARPRNGVADGRPMADVRDTTQPYTTRSDGYLGSPVEDERGEAR